MHELPIMKSILAVALRQAEASAPGRPIRGVDLTAGAARDLVPELMQRYWAHITRGTAAQGSVLGISLVPISFECARCGQVFPHALADLDALACPACGGAEAGLHTGQELYITGVRVAETERE